MIINKIKTFTQLQPFFKINILFRNMETESLRISNAVVDYNVRQEPNYMEESEEIMKYIFNGIKENVKFSEIASDSVPALGYTIDPRSFAYTVEYLREQVSKQGIEETIMFNNLITNTDDLGLYESTGDAVVLKSNYKDIYNDYISNIVFNKSETNDISEKDTTSNTEETASDMDSDTSSNTVSESASDTASATNLDMVLDTKQQDIEILNYITRSINTETPLSCIIKESVNLGYSISATSFFNAMDTLIKNDVDMMLNYLRKYDDVELYFILDDNDIRKYKTSDKEYYLILQETASDSETGTASDTSERYYSIPVESTSNSNASNSGISFEHDLNLKDNKTILILTIMTFITIKAIVWYVSTYHKNTLIDNDNIKETSESHLNSVYESMLTLNEILYKLLICLIPTFLIIVYNLRYYYFYKIKYFSRKTK